MKCVSGKRVYESEELALDALIQNQIRNHYRDGSGPVNVYECHECKNWHFTSKGPKADILEDPETIQRIRKEREGLEWESRLR